MIKRTFYYYSSRKGYSELWCCYMKPKTAESLILRLGLPNITCLSHEGFMKNSFCKLREVVPPEEYPEPEDHYWSVHVKCSSGTKTFNPYYYKTRKGRDRYLD